MSDGLRVADASVLPTVPHANTNLSAILVGRDRPPVSWRATERPTACGSGSGCRRAPMPCRPRPSSTGRPAPTRGPFSSLAVLDRVVLPSHEPLLALAAAVGVTRRIRPAGRASSSRPTRETTLLARQAASLDALSGGRFSLGVGVGVRRDDYLATGQAFERRGRRLDEQLADPPPAVGGRAAGRPVSARSASRRRGPVGPELLIGGYVPAVARRVAEHGDGFMAPGGGEPARMAALWAAIEAAWAAAGRTGRPRWVGSSYVALGPDADAQAADYIRSTYAFDPALAERRLAGIPTTPAAVRAVLRRQADMGVDEFVFRPCAADPSLLDRSGRPRRRTRPRPSRGPDGRRQPSLVRRPAGCAPRCSRPRRPSPGPMASYRALDIGMTPSSLGSVGRGLRHRARSRSPSRSAGSSTASGSRASCSARASSWRPRPFGLAFVDSVLGLLLLLAGLGLAQLVFVVANQTAVSDRTRGRRLRRPVRAPLVRGLAGPAHRTGRGRSDRRFRHGGQAPARPCCSAASWHWLAVPLGLTMRRLDPGDRWLPAASSSVPSPSVLVILRHAGDGPGDARQPDRPLGDGHPRRLPARARARSGASRRR